MNSVNSAAPVLLAVCQVTLTELPKAAEKFDDVHEAVRKEGFPRAQRGAIQQVNITHIGTQVKQEVREEPMLLLNSADNLWAVQMTSNRVVLATKAYSGFAEFKAKLTLLLQAVDQHLSPTHFTSCGFRYLDLIAPNEQLALSEMLIPGCLGPQIDDMFPRLEGVTAASFQTHEGTLLVRSWFKPPQVITADLLPVAQWLNLLPELPPDDFVVLDTDHIAGDVNSIQTFSVEAAIGRIETLKIGARAAFNRFTTPEARRAWGISQ